MGNRPFRTGPFRTGGTPAPMAGKQVCKGHPVHNIAMCMVVSCCTNIFLQLVKAYNFSSSGFILGSCASTLHFFSCQSLNMQAGVIVDTAELVPL